MRYLNELVTWIAELDPAAAFLFSMPFLVVAAAFVRSWFDEGGTDANPFAGPVPREREKR
jgi:hypothetical protein